MSRRNDSHDVPLYSLGQPSERTGIAGLSMVTTYIVIGGGVGFLIVQMLGQPSIAFFVVLPVTAVAAFLSWLRIGGRTVAKVILMWAQNLMSVSRGESVYVSGPSSSIPGGHYLLPGVLVRTRLLSGVDAVGRPFAAVYSESRREATVLIDCQLSGQTALTQSERDAQTASWGHWLAQLSLGGGVVSAAVVVSCRPGTGDLVRQEVLSNVSEQAPWIAQQIQFEAAELLSSGIPEVDSHIAVTFDVSMAGGDEDRVLEQLGTRLPMLYESLAWCGIQGEPMAASAVCARVHSFFNPAAERDLEQVRVRGESMDLQWEDIGPAWAEKTPRAYCHEAVVSQTWEMVQAPRSAFEDRVLQWLVAPHTRIPRKRVCLVYRPFSAASGARRVELEHRDALVAARSSKKVQSAAAQVRVEHTEAARHAQAKGAQLGRYSLFVTATVEQGDDLRRVAHDVVQLGEQSMVRLRPMKYQQDVGFAIACGVGWVPWSKSSTSSLFNEL